MERKSNAAAATHVGAASHFTLDETVLCVFLSNQLTNLSLVFLSVSSSASEDLGCRRGDFSRKHYGSVELVSPRPFAAVLLCSWLPSVGTKRDGREEVGLMSHDTLGVVRSSAVAGAVHSGQQPGFICQSGFFLLFSDVFLPLFPHLGFF